ncbi:MAG: hypothetical protein LBC61_00540 [Candidatus Peribacteria bacterium]|nr:hypothetical protein [Candidatus Peribacteria bacterium]
MLQEMRNQQLFGRTFECQKIRFHTSQKKIIGGQLEILDLVDQIQKYFIGLGKKSFHQNEVMFEMMKIIGWKFGTMYLWSLINFQTEN